MEEFRFSHIICSRIYKGTKQYMVNWFPSWIDESKIQLYDEYAYNIAEQINEGGVDKLLVEWKPTWVNTGEIDEVAVERFEKNRRDMRRLRRAQLQTEKKKYKESRQKERADIHSPTDNE